MSSQSHPHLSSAKPWLAEKEVGAELARQLILQQFPELDPLFLSLLGMGWDNLVYTVNQDYVFRFPRRTMALALMQTEWKLLDVLAPLVPLAIPRPLFDGQASPGFDWPFAGYTLVAGQTADLARLKVGDRQKAVSVLAGFLKILHSHKSEFAKGLCLPDDVMAKVDIGQRRPQIQERLQQAQGIGLLSDTLTYEHLLAALPESTPGNRPKCLVHGDLYVRHLVVDALQNVTGVIDWGDAHLGDPATDLSLVFAFLPPDLHGEFWAGYGQVEPMTKILARFRALFHSLALLLYAHDTGDTDLLRESRLALDWIAESQLNQVQFD